MMFSYNLAKTDIRNKRSLIEWILIILVFIFSLLNSVSLLIAMGLSLILLSQKEVGAVKILNLITLRTIFNPSIASGIGVWQNIKWLIIFGCSIYLLTAFFKLNKGLQNKIKWIIISLAVFMFYNIVVALNISSLPLVSIFKTISYVLVFMGILVGVGYTKDKLNWIDWLFKLFFMFTITSFVTIFSPVGYVINGSLQGMSNHPNMFGIFLVLFLTILLVFSNITKRLNKLVLLLLLLIILYMIILSESRTSFIAYSVVLLMYLLLSVKVKVTFLKAGIISLSTALLLLIGNSTWENSIEFLSDFMEKGQKSGEILVSREKQVETLINSFNKSPIFGNGFMVPVLPFKSYEFNANYIVEPGNIMLSLLSFTGVFGFVIFWVYIFLIFRANKYFLSTSLLLLIAPLLISLGEMVFFSSNNIGIWCYMFIALYVFFESTEKYSS